MRYNGTYWHFFFKFVLRTLMILCDRLRQYEASGKCYYWRTHCASHYFVYYTVTASCKSIWILCKLLNKHYFNAFALISKHLYSYKEYKLRWSRVLKFCTLIPCIFTSDEPLIDFNTNIVTFETRWRRWMKLICAIPPNTKTRTT